MSEIGKCPHSQGNNRRKSSSFMSESLTYMHVKALPEVSGSMLSRSELREFAELLVRADCPPAKESLRPFDHPDRSRSTGRIVEPLALVPPESCKIL